MKNRLSILRVPRPAHVRAQADELVQALSSCDSMEWLYKINTNGHRVKRPLCSDLEALAAAVHFGPLDENAFTHQC